MKSVAFRDFQLFLKTLCSAGQPAGKFLLKIFTLRPSGALDGITLDWSYQPYAPPGLPIGILDGNIFEAYFRLSQLKMAYPVIFKPRRGVRLIEMNVLWIFRAPEGRKVQ